MKQLQHRLLARLKTIKKESMVLDELPPIKERLWMAFTDVYKEMEEGIASNFLEFADHIIIAFNYDIDKIIDHLQRSIENRFDELTLKDDIEEGFDTRYCTETCLIAEQLELPEAMSLERIKSSSRVHPTPIKAFRAVLRTLEKHQLRFDRWIFIDIGSGLGRNLMLASNISFKSIIGIEISSFLSTKSYQNIERFNERSQKKCLAEVYCQDALSFHLPKGDTVLYFWEPFNMETMNKFVTKIEKQIKDHDTKYILVFLGHEYNVKSAPSFSLFDTEQVYISELARSIPLSYYSSR